MKNINVHRYTLILFTGLLAGTCFFSLIPVQAVTTPPPVPIITKTVTPTVVGLGQPATVTITVTGVTEASVSPRAILVNELVNENLIVDLASFSRKPDEYVENPYYNNQLQITWREIALDVGDYDHELEAGETWEVSFTVRPLLIGAGQYIDGEISNIAYLGPDYPEPIYYEDIPQAWLSVVSIEPSMALTNLENLITTPSFRIFKGETPRQVNQIQQALQHKLNLVITLYENGHSTAGYNKLMNDIAPKLADPWRTPTTRQTSWLTRNPKYTLDVKGYAKLCSNLIKLQPNPSPQ